jgi:hypothetical protein
MRVLYDVEGGRVVILAVVMKSDVAAWLAEEGRKS